MTINKLSGTLVFVQVDTPKTCYVQEKGSEWKASIVVSEDDADAWDDVFNKQPAKQVKTSEFKEVFKIDPPFPDQRKQYIITLRKNTKLGNGNDVPLQYQPKVFQQKGKVLVDITKSILVANGSVGQMSVDIYEGKMGVFARLKNVLVTELIEYVKPENSAKDPGSEFGFSVEASEDSPEKVVKKTSAKKSPKPEESDDSDEQSPF